MKIENVYVIRHGENDNYQTYFLELELMSNTRQNVDIWEEFFSKINDGEPVTIIIERGTK